MHKITLKFLDQSIEQKYQQEHQIPKRRTHLKIFMLFFIVLQIIKLTIALIIQNYDVAYPILGMMGCTALSKFFNFNKEYHQRALIIYINICFSIYVLFFDPPSDTPTMYFRGAHQMIINVINILGTEFLDSTMTITVLYSLRIFHLVKNSSSIDITSVIMGLGSNLSLLVIVYLYHKAIRSQFLLTQINQRWENILKQILHNSKFILINFQIEKLQFQSITSTFSQTIQSKEEVLNFLRESKVENDSLEQYLFQKLQDYSQNYQEIINHAVNIKFNKQIMQVDFSIFFGNQPTILIQTRQSKLHSQNQEIQQVCQQYLKLLIIFIRIIKENIPFDKIQFHNIANKIQFQDLMIQIWNSQLLCKTISLKKSLQKIQKYSNPNTTIQLVSPNYFINTIPKIFYLLLAFIVDCQTSELIIIKGETLDTNLNKIKLQGKFNIRKLNYYISKIKFYFLLICKEINAEQFCINLEFNDEIFSPFTNIIMPQLNFGYLNQNFIQ
ncbi:unnamed protein product [Paramecium primaurelia]|uniref:Transmembrane protein n=1 Tax=Paramecium primaurelia TaxID=5886 RepID=A0A8S1PPP3_PARPR|nr:unnamed protein product [Paramecium primaurelia]